MWKFFMRIILKIALFKYNIENRRRTVMGKGKRGCLERGGQECTDSACILAKKLDAAGNRLAAASCPPQQRLRASPGR
jgi:hypothetical protein